MRGPEVFARALRGDRASLETLRRGAHVLCVVEPLSTVLRVVAEPDGGQEAVLATVGASGGGTVLRLAVPRAFRIDGAGHDATHLVLRAVDGRTVRATPGQFGTHVRLLPPDHNPLYEEQSTEAFLAAPLLPRGDWPPGPHPSGAGRGPRGDHLRPGPGGLRGRGHARRPVPATVVRRRRRREDRGTGAPRRRLAEALPSIGAAGGEFLRSRAADGTEPAEEKARFLDALRPGGLVVYRSGGFEVHFDDTSADYFPEGYWPAVRYRADRTPVSVSVEA
ncbi:hypothetical protein LUW75_16275 [Streptomyces sp. MRC013]|uniref:hypothetical protein n=1 Tax=Streptomyces sp. MRC013 TaxID=2898276 RepID=UPI002025C387|nr:hypothetical protein [Streptomyces sp. MRC013]URM91278.1 hypothetical protein LUW75_16275 [Streptomyces sp. MRC013]